MWRALLSLWQKRSSWYAVVAEEYWRCNYMSLVVVTTSHTNLQSLAHVTQDLPSLHELVVSQAYGRYTIPFLNNSLPQEAPHGTRPKMLINGIHELGEKAQHEPQWYIWKKPCFLNGQKLSQLHLVCFFISCLPIWTMNGVVFCLPSPYIYKWMYRAIIEYRLLPLRMQIKIFLSSFYVKETIIL